MVKSITSAGNIVKTAALGALLAGSVALGATNPVKTTKQTSVPNQTEVVSKDGAEAVKAMTLPQQPKPAVPTVHNKKLDEKFLKLAETDDEKKYVNDLLSKIYITNGSYLGSAMVQQNIDINMFLAFLDGDIEILKKFDEEAYNKIDRDVMKQVVEKSEPIKQWLNENYFKAYNEPFGQFDHTPDARELKASIDSYVEEDPNKLFENGQLTFKYHSMLYREKVEESSMSIPLKYSNLIAYEVNRADYILFTNLLEVSGLCKGYDKNLEILMDMIAPDVE